MPLQTSGAISLNQIHVEAGGASGTQASLNDSDIRALIGKSSGAQMAFSEWYGASASQTIASGNSHYSAGSQYTPAIHGMAATDLGGMTLAVPLITNHPTFQLNSRNMRFAMFSFAHHNNSLNLLIGDLGTTSTSYNGHPSNSGWSTLTLSGGASRTLSRSAASFTGTTTSIAGGLRSAGSWSWVSQTNPFPNSHNTTSFTIVLS